MIVLRLDPVAERHLARALETHARWCRANGLALPAALAQLSLVARSGQERTDGHDDDDLAHTVDVNRIALTYEEVAEALSVSVRSVRRMAANNELPTIEIAGRRRVHRDDLASYAASLRAENRSA